MSINEHETRSQNFHSEIPHLRMVTVYESELHVLDSGDEQWDDVDKIYGSSDLATESVHLETGVTYLAGIVARRTTYCRHDHKQSLGQNHSLKSPDCCTADPVKVEGQQGNQ